ncbi:STAS domain-containing protein [Streptomyces sp. 846.5]|nr:STAS domain-containing protein [Streptomyces sp. 846.5]
MDDPRWLLCDVSALTEPGLGDLGALARLQLAARRSGRELRLVGAGERLRELIALAGLADELPLLALPGLLQPGPFQPWGQPEQREQGLGVEEAVQPDDPPG